MHQIQLSTELIQINQDYSYNMNSADSLLDILSEDQTIQTPSSRFPQMKFQMDQDSQYQLINRPFNIEQKIIETKLKVQQIDTFIQIQTIQKSLASHEKQGDTKVMKKIKYIQKTPKGKQKKDFYPTHNILTPVMKIHLKYIYKNFKGANQNSKLTRLLEKFKIGQKFQDSQLGFNSSASNIQRLEKKQNSTNMKQFNDLYQASQLKEILDQFFEQRVLFRELLMSRINYDSRNAFFQNIKVFQESYKRKQFKITNLKAHVVRSKESKKRHVM